MTDLDAEDTTVINPVGRRRVVSDDEVTHVYRRPTPVEWAQAPRRKRRAKQSSHHPVTKTRPAFRYMVGMPVVPAVAGAALHVPAAASAARESSLLRKWIGVVAVLTTSLAALLAFGASPSAPASDGFVVVSAAATSGAPRSLKVFADGEQRCSAVPCELVLAPGDHFVSVVAPGFERETSRRVSVSAGVESNVHFDLVPRGE
jgi:hypothetical protein